MRLRSLWCIVAALAATSTSCAEGSGEHAEPDFVCLVTAPTECTDPSLTFAAVKPIFDEHCVTCHSGLVSNGPWPLYDYQHVADWQDTVRADVLDCSMPPPEGVVTMTSAEREAILHWIRCGFRE